MTLHGIRHLDENKLILWVKKWNAEQDERLYVRRTVLPVLEKWEGKKPNVRMQAEIKAALTKPGEECPYIVSGPKDYDWQRFSIYGRDTWSENATSLIKHGSTVMVDLGRLKSHNLTAITKETVNQAKQYIDELQKRRDQIKTLLDSAAKATNPIRLAVQSFNAHLDGLNAVQESMRPYNLNYLFSGDWNREYDIYK